MSQSTPKTTVHRAPGPPDYWLMKRLWTVARDPMGFYERSWKSYGDIVRLHWYGQFHAYVLVHPEMVERVLQSNWSNYSKGFFFKRLSVFSGQGLFTSEGDLWIKQRRLCQPAFHRQKISALAGGMSATAGEMLDRWDQTSDHHRFDLASEMMRLTLKIAARGLFGADLTEERQEKLHEQMNIAVKHVDHRFNPLTLPEKVPTNRNREFLNAKQNMNHWILDLAAKRRASGERPGDLLSMLIDARDEETGEGMSDQQLTDEVRTLLVAAHETSGDALSWAWSLLAAHPEKRERLEEEADRVLNGRLPTFEDTPNLPYAQAVFQETLRLYPSVWALTREARKDDEIAGYHIGARSTIAVVPFLTHRHPEFWDNPDEFRPERFIEGPPRHRFAFYPFGGGPRLCIGMGFAYLEGQMVLAAMANRYRFEMAPGVTPMMHPSLTLRPRNGLQMIRHRRH